MSWADFKWSEINALYVLASAGLAALLWGVRSAMGSSFVKADTFNKLEENVSKFAEEIEKMRGGMDERMKHFELRLSQVPLRDDLSRLADRTACVEREVAVMQANLIAVKEIVLGIGHNTDLLVQHHMGEKGS